MNTLNQLNDNSLRHPSKIMSAMRIVLGGILIWKGIQFGNNQKDIQIMIANSPFDFLSLLIVQYAVIVQFAAGVMITIGLLTRVAVLFELPLVIGAMIYSHAGAIFPFGPNEDLAFLVLLLLITFGLYGSGGFSADRYLRMHPNG